MTIDVEILGYDPADGFLTIRNRSRRMLTVRLPVHDTYCVFLIWPHMTATFQVFP